MGGVPGMAPGMGLGMGPWMSGIPGMTPGMAQWMSGAPTGSAEDDTANKDQKEEDEEEDLEGGEDALDAESNDPVTPKKRRLSRMKSDGLALKGAYMGGSGTVLASAYAPESSPPC